MTAIVVAGVVGFVMGGMAAFTLFNELTEPAASGDPLEQAMYSNHTQAPSRSGTLGGALGSAARQSGQPEGSINSGGPFGVQEALFVIGRLAGSIDRLRERMGPILLPEPVVATSLPDLNNQVGAMRPSEVRNAIGDIGSRLRALEASVCDLIERLDI